MRPWLFPTLLGLAAGLTGCRGEDIAFDCDNQAQSFRQSTEDDEQTLVAVPESGGPYPVGIQLSEEGVNRLLKSVIEDGVPFGGGIPFGILPEGPADATFEPESEPEILLQAVPGCPNCVVFSLQFGVQLAQGDEPLSSGVGWAHLSIPLLLEGDEATGDTVMVADYGEARIVDWHLSVFGFDSDTHVALGGALRILMEENIAEMFGRKEMMQIGSWNIGQNNVRVLARELFVQPEESKLAIGMATNLPLSPMGTLDLTRPMPEGIPMQILMHDELFFRMTQQMFAEGEIPRRYNEDGAPEEDGTYGVTLESLTVSSGERLSTEFRAWRIAEGYCGWATAQMPLQVSVNEPMTGLAVAAGDAVLDPDGTKAEGSGSAAQEEQALFDDNQDLIATFRASLVDKVGDTLNYAELDLENDDIVFTTKSVTADIERRALITDLDFFTVAEE